MAQQQTDGGRLAGAIGSEVADRLAFGHLKVQVSQRLGGAVTLGQAAVRIAIAPTGPAPLSVDAMFLAYLTVVISLWRETEGGRLSPVP